MPTYHAERTTEKNEWLNRKPLDKPLKMWYNKNVKRGGWSPYPTTARPKISKEILKTLLTATKKCGIMNTESERDKKSPLNKFKGGSQKQPERN